MKQESEEEHVAQSACEPVEHCERALGTGPATSMPVRSGSDAVLLVGQRLAPQRAQRPPLMQVMAWQSTHVANHQKPKGPTSMRAMQSVVATMPQRRRRLLQAVSPSLGA